LPEEKSGKNMGSIGPKPTMVIGGQEVPVTKPHVIQVDNPQLVHEEGKKPGLMARS
jgi:hypothetical protein